MSSRLKLSLVMFSLAITFIFFIGEASAILDGCYNVGGSQTTTVKVLGRKVPLSTDFDDTFCFYPDTASRGHFDDSSGLKGNFIQNDNTFKVTYNKVLMKRLFKQMFRSSGLRNVSVQIIKAHINGVQSGSTIYGTLFANGRGAATYGGRHFSFTFNAKGNFDSYSYSSYSQQIFPYDADTFNADGYGMNNSTANRSGIMIQEIINNIINEVEK